MTCDSRMHEVALSTLFFESTARSKTIPSVVLEVHVAHHRGDCTRYLVSNSLASAISRYTHAPSSERGVAAPANVAAVIGEHGNMFDLNTDEGRQREYIKHTWAYVIACGAIVELPASNVPEIIVSPDTKASSIPMSKSYYEAITGPYRRYWIEAIRVELENLLGKKVCREERMPHGFTPVCGKYVWKVKTTDTGTIAKWKARWIVQGFRQRSGRDFDKTFVGVANIVTVRSILAVVCELGWEVHQMDVKAAYPCVEIEKTVRMYKQCPDGCALTPKMNARVLPL